MTKAAMCSKKKKKGKEQCFGSMVKKIGQVSMKVSFKFSCFYYLVIETSFLFFSLCQVSLALLDAISNSYFFLPNLGGAGQGQTLFCPKLAKHDTKYFLSNSNLTQPLQIFRSLAPQVVFYQAINE